MQKLLKIPGFSRLISDFCLKFQVFINYSNYSFLQDSRFFGTPVSITSDKVINHYKGKSKNIKH